MIPIIMPTSVCAVTCNSVRFQFNARHVEVRLHSFCFHLSHILTLQAREMTRLVPTTGDIYQANCGLVISVGTPVQISKYFAFVSYQTVTELQIFYVYLCVWYTLFVTTNSCIVVTPQTSVLGKLVLNPTLATGWLVEDLPDFFIFYNLPL
jgi:hypothetical protein